MKVISKAAILNALKNGGCVRHYVVYQYYRVYDADGVELGAARWDTMHNLCAAGDLVKHFGGWTNVDTYTAAQPAPVEEPAPAADPEPADELPALRNVYTGEIITAPARPLYNALRYTIRSRVHDTGYSGTNRDAVTLARWAMLDDWQPVHAFGPLRTLEARIIDAVRDRVPGWFPSEYALKERLFEARTDALCENVPPHKCDCTRCPARDLCAWLDWWEKGR